MNKVTKREIYELIRFIKGAIQGDDRAHEDSDEPGVQLTIGTDDVQSDYGWQTGDNSYDGAYFFPHWAVIEVYRDSNCRELVNDVFDQWGELIAQVREFQSWKLKDMK